MASWGKQALPNNVHTGIKRPENAPTSTQQIYGSEIQTETDCMSVSAQDPGGISRLIPDR